MFAAACDRPAATTDDVLVEWKLTPSPAVVNSDALAEITVIDRATRAPITGADLAIQAHMAHPGMVPVIEHTSEQAPGVYRAGLRLTMAGDWNVTLNGTLADGRPMRRDVADVSASTVD